MNNVQSIVNFAYFTANFDSKFIEKCWSDDPHLIDHLLLKLHSISENNFISCGDFMHWFFELDRENQIKLASWINENYKGISF